MNATTPTQPATPAPDLSIRARPPSPRRLSRKVLLAGALSAGGVIALALFFGLSERPDRKVAQADAVAAAGGPPETIRNAANTYEANDLPKAELEPPRDMLWGDSPPPKPAALTPPDDPIWSNNGAEGARPTPRRPPPPDPQAMASAAPIKFGPPSRSSASASATNVAMGAGDRSAFLASQRGDDGRLDASLTPPRSRYELIAGAVIPAALLTELNSDLPGRVIAQVTSPVYDSVTGEHVLIPQGARLIGTYDSTTNHGDNRILLAWNRIVMPNGWSINLKGMEATDPSGAAGLRDRTDNHLGPLAGAIGLSAIISVIANNAEDKSDNRNLGQSVGDAAAQEAARTGGRIVDRQLQVHPNLRVRAGAPVRVLVTRDIGLKPYQEAAR